MRELKRDKTYYFNLYINFMIFYLWLFNYVFLLIKIK